MIPIQTYTNIDLEQINALMVVITEFNLLPEVICEIINYARSHPDLSYTKIVQMASEKKIKPN